MTTATILIVDDDVDTRLLVSAQLRKYRYRALCAADASEAIAVVQKTRPDAIILDLGLPGDDGFNVIKQLKADAALAGIPVIILTADEVSEVERTGLGSGAAALLHKPARAEVLLAAITNVLGPSGRASGEGAAATAMNDESRRQRGAPGAPDSEREDIEP